MPPAKYYAQAIFHSRTLHLTPAIRGIFRLKSYHQTPKDGTWADSFLQFIYIHVLFNVDFLIPIKCLKIFLLLGCTEFHRA